MDFKNKELSLEGTDLDVGDLDLVEQVGVVAEDFLKCVGNVPDHVRELACLALEGMKGERMHGQWHCKCAASFTIAHLI
jgi:hypothetical protein